MSTSMSVVRGGSVIQATGKTDFEDGSRTGNKLEVRNGLQSVRTREGVADHFVIDYSYCRISGIQGLIPLIL